MHPVNRAFKVLTKSKGMAFAGKRRYNIKLWKTFTDCFNCLPVAAIVDEKIFCCHGGLSPDLQSMEQIRRIMRPTDVPDQGLLCDLLWSDPDKVRMLPNGYSLQAPPLTFSVTCSLVDFIFRTQWDGERTIEAYPSHSALKLSPNSYTNTTLI